MSKLRYSFSTDYMVLLPHNAGPIEVLLLLLSPKIGRNRAVGCFTHTKEGSFARRLAMLFNLLLQILLHSLVGPVATLGTAIEFAINLVDNILHGRLEHPNKSSAMYRSITGFFDRNVDLDGSIEPSDKQFDSALCMRASKLAYENEAFIRNVVTRHWKMEFVRFFNCKNEFQSACTAQAFVFCDKAVDPDLVVVAYRGTRPFDMARWCADLDPSWYEILNLGLVPATLTQALGVQPNVGLPKWVETKCEEVELVYAYYTIRDTVKKLLDENKKARLLVTGHGSGGVLASLFESILKFHNETLILERLAGVYMYPSGKTWPCSAIHFLHFGIGRDFNKTDTSKVQQQIQGKETSSSILDFVRSWINWVWKLGHGVYKGYKCVSNIPGGWLLLLMRVFALVLPVLPFHWVRNYISGVLLRGYIPNLARGMAWYHRK
ncbi:unnamed protein product [Urochloa decumbens]|uniref:Fungal lipase-type domain-containing protein n=1 Tax=Urochloa decumbens TaxID=240449 RepID=A0ABC9B1Z2_9POAL